MNRRILEREHELAVLAGAARDAADGHGSVVLVFGEAGIGKSSVVEMARSHLPAEGRMLVGYCDDLATKPTLGPFRDLAGSVGTELARALIDGTDRDRVLASLRSELDWPGHPTALVIEDVHWADDATFDALRYLIRRIAQLPAVLLLTYRDDELTRDHPLHQLLGLASRADRCHKLPLRHLSETAVRQLSGDGTDAHHVFTVTAGNPFFVTELLATGAEATVPATVVDAVLARVRRLEPDVQDVLEQLAVVPSTIDTQLVDALVPGGIGRLAPAEQYGLLTVSPSRVAFRHELTRRAIVDALPASRRVELNRRVLAALIDRGADLSYLVHHAAEAGDREAISSYGPAAAKEAALAGAHREAAAHYRLVLEQRERFEPEARAELLESYAVECYTIGAAQDAVSAQQDAVTLYRTLPDVRALAAALRWLSRVHWWAGDTAAADEAAVEATAVAEECADDGLLAIALSNQSQLHMLAYRADEAIQLGERAALLAERADDKATHSHALTNVGMAQWGVGDPAGRATLRSALESALACGALDHALRAYIAISSGLIDDFQLADADSYLSDALRLAEDSEHLGYHSYLVLERARLELLRARWDEVARLAEFALTERPPLRWGALLAIGRAKVRQGQPDGEELLTQGWQLAVEMQELQRTGPIAAGLAEAAWLRGDSAAVRAIAEPVHEEARQLGEIAIRAELGYWLSKAGRPVEEASGGRDRPGRATEDPAYLLAASGDWRGAAAVWHQAGSPYEYAAALADSEDPDQLLVSLGILDRIGAQPLARIVRNRLRAAGATRIPRGPVEPTRRNPAGLTERQLTIVRLFSRGMTNSDIARELTLSIRTVDSHVAASLAKLGCKTRRDAAARAAELGLLEPRSQ